ITPVDTCIIKENIVDSLSMINVYLQTDTIPGLAYSTKVNNKTYFNLYSQLVKSNFVFIFNSFEDKTTETDIIYIFDIPAALGCYHIIDPSFNATFEGKTNAYFSNNDGDVIIDEYLLDTSRTDNRIEITRLDTLNKIVEGKFAISFVFAHNRPKRSPYNLERMRFFNGIFRGKYTE
ncbi:MAG: hypothetical protein ABIO44_05845, partial [Saprospiraceae bacterium]